MTDKTYSQCEKIADNFIKDKYNIDVLDKKVDFDILKANIIQHALLDEIRVCLHNIMWSLIGIICILSFILSKMF